MNRKKNDDYTFFLDSVPPFSETMDLIGMFNLLNVLDNFHLHLSVIHIAGTNGKGSCTAMLDSIYRANGYSVGTFMSPYIRDYRECIHIHGILISIKAMNAATQVIEKAYRYLESSGKKLPTKYECITCIALYAMHQAEVDLAIIETLMGGKDDATNVFTKIEAALITSIGFDHMEFLGNSLTEIALHKAGIIKKDCPVFINPNSIEVLNVIERYSKKINAPFYISEDFLKHSSIDITPYLPLPLNGSHQIDNFLGVMSIITYLNSKYPVASYKITNGLTKLNHPCRIETITIKGHKITFDGSHNKEGLIALYNYLLECKKTSDIPVTLVFGTLKGKNFHEGLSLLAQLSSEVILTTPESPRALDITSYLKDTYIPFPKISDSIAHIQHMINIRTTPVHIVICGSFYIACPFRNALYKLSDTL